MDKRIPKIELDRTSNKYYFILSPEICNILLFDYQVTQGLKLCHKEKDILERLLTAIFDLHSALKLLHESRIREIKKTSLLAIAVLLLFAAAIFYEVFVSNFYSAMKLFLSIWILFFGVIACSLILIRCIHLARTIDAKSSASLVEINERIHNAFLC